MDFKNLNGVLAFILLNLLVFTVRYVIFMIQRRLGTLRIEVLSRVQSGFRCIFESEFELTQRVRNTRK